jgi:cardiolipin synthase A/B
VAGWLLADNSYGWAASALAMALLAYVLRAPERPPALGLDHTVRMGSREFLDTAAGLSGIRFEPGTHLEVLENGDAFYGAMLDAIRQARVSVTMEHYIFWPGEIGEAFAHALAERARAGLLVKLLLDAVGSSTLGDHVLGILKDGGCEVAWYNEIHWYTPGRFNNRTHRKSLVVDGRIGFTGGAGIADHWRGTAAAPGEWRDTQVRLEGPAVARLQTGFAQNWLRTTGEVLQGDALFPPPEHAGTCDVQVINSSPDSGASAVRLMYHLAIVSARRRIDIVNPYFVPDEVSVETLAEATARGVQVRVLVAGRRSDNWLARQNSVRLYGALLDSGIKVYEYHRTMLHQKVMLVDGCWCTVGTSNFDNRSFAHNEETNICTADPRTVQVLAAAFAEDLAASVEVLREHWRARGLWARSQETLASLLQDQV